MTGRIESKFLNSRNIVRGDANDIRGLKAAALPEFNSRVQFHILPQMKSCLYVIIFLFSLSASAQLENELFKLQDEMPVHDSLSGRLYAQVNHLQYFKNNEYFSPIQVGLTYFGWQLSPSLVYHPNGKTRVEGGLYLRKDFGNNGLRDIIPIVSLKFKPDEHNEFILGNIQGSLSHGLIEPLYDFERVIYDRQELGSQHRFNSHEYSHSAWIKWEKMLYRGDPYQESVTGGLSSVIHVKRRNLKIAGSNEIPQGAYLEIPIQMIANHRGGQIDSTDLPILTMVNYCGGINTGYRFRPGAFVQDLNLQAYAVFYNLLENRPLPFKSGNGYYLNLEVKTKIHQTLMFSYWEGNGYMASRGGTLYQSVSQEGTGYTETNRRILIVRLLSEKRLFDDFYVSLRLEPYYEFKTKNLDYSHAVYVSYKHAWRLKKSAE